MWIKAGNKQSQVAKAAFFIPRMEIDMNTEKMTSFEEAAKPLIKWMAENVHPHHSAIVTCTDAELLMSECVVKTEEFLKD